MKAILIIIFSVFIIITLGIIIYLWIQNRNSELLTSKILSAILVAVIAILSALLFSLKNEDIELKFASTLFFSKLDKKPLDDHLSGDGWLKFGGRQFHGKLSLFINKQLKEREDLSDTEVNKYPDKVVDFYHNMILVKIIKQFFWMYSARWDTNIYSVRRGRTILKESYADSGEMSPSYDILKWEDLLNKKPKNDFYNLISGLCNISETKVPPKTKVDFIITKRK